MRRQPEKQTQRDIESNLAKLGFFVSHMSQPRHTMLTLGIPDVYAAHPRWKIAFWCECKAGKNRLTPVQDVWHQVHRAAGVDVITAWSWSDVYDYLKSKGAPLP